MRQILVPWESLLDVYLNLQKSTTDKILKVRLLLALGSLFKDWYVARCWRISKPFHTFFMFQLRHTRIPCTYCLTHIALVCDKNSNTNRYEYVLHGQGVKDVDRLELRRKADRLVQHLRAAISELTHYGATVPASLKSEISGEIQEMRASCHRISKWKLEGGGDEEDRLYFGL